MTLTSVMPTDARYLSAITERLVLIIRKKQYEIMISNRPRPTRMVITEL